jgi:hypothetical protein
MRIALASNLESRDGTVDQDAKVLNGIAESRGDKAPMKLRKRPGLAAYGAAASQLALLYAISRTYNTDSTSSVAIGDQSYATKYAMSCDEGETSTTAGEVYTWGGSSWSHYAVAPINANNLGTLAFGCVQLDGFFFMMTQAGKIFNTGLNGIAFTAATDYISLANDGGTAKAITRLRNYIIGFTTATMQPFYDAGNPTGSVLAAVGGGMIGVGCVHGRTIAHHKDQMFWLGREAQRGVGVYEMRGLEAQRVSTPAVDRILAADNYATLYGTCVTAGGHDFYLLSLITTNITLAYDIGTGQWGIWTVSNPAATKAVTSITRSGTTATVTCGVVHTLSDGDPVVMAGADQADYNGIFQITYVSTAAFTIEVANSPVTPATGTITAGPYTQGYFPIVRYVGVEGAGAGLLSTGTTWYKFADTTYQDAGAPIDFTSRTKRLDFGTTDRKTMPRITVIGDSVSSSAMIRWSDDDYTTNSAYRRVTLSDDRPMLRRCGNFERRSIEFKHVENTACAIDALELDVGK